MMVLIKGVKFSVKLLSRENYINLHNDKSYAHFDKEKKHLVFRSDHINKKIVIHETCHAYINSLHLASCSDLTIEDFEEIICELLEEHLLDINRTANEIISFLKQEKRKNDKRRKR